jgi:hypothetical protein
MGSSSYPSGPASLFSAIARTDIFAASQVWSISIHGGRVLPKERNVRPVVCQACRHTALTNAACKFIAGRFSPLPGGYICIDCIASALRSTDWHFQTVQEMLFPRQTVLTSAPIISGKALSKAFLDRGERGLFWVVSGGSIGSMYSA